MRNKVTLIGDNAPEYFTSDDRKVLYCKISGGIIEVDNGNKSLTLKSLNHLADEYHSIDELYEFRKMYNALLFNEWAKTSDKTYAAYVKIKDEYIKAYISNYGVHKSWKHYDGEDCFGGGWFIVSAMLPTGLISNHYKAEDWDLFQVPEVEKALYEFDGHTGADVLKRLKALTNK